MPYSFFKKAILFSEEYRLFEKLLIDAEFALMDAAAPCQNGVDVLLRNRKSGGFFFLRFCDNFLLLFNCGERYA